MPPEEESTPPQKTDDAADPAATRSRERMRGVVLTVLAILALTALLTLATETFWKRPNATTTTRGNDVTNTGIVAAPRPSGEVIIVAVSFEDLRVDGVEITRTGPFIDSKRVQPIPPLKTAMEERRGANAVGGRVGLIVEKGMPPEMIKSVFATLALAGYRDVHLVNALGDASNRLNDN